MEQITIMENDRVGLLAEIAENLGSAGININSLCAECAEGKAVIMLTASDAVAARKLLANRYALSVAQVAAAENKIRFHPIAMAVQSAGGRAGGEAV